MKLKVKKLELNKTTISNLDKQEMKQINGASMILKSCFCEETVSCSVWFCCPPEENQAELNFGL